MEFHGFFCVTISCSKRYHKKIFSIIHIVFFFICVYPISHVLWSFCAMDWKKKKQQKNDEAVSDVCTNKMEIPQHNTEEKNCIMIIANAQSSVDFSQFIRSFLIRCSRKFVEFIGMFTNRYDAIISLGITPNNPVSNINLRRSSQSLNWLMYCAAIPTKLLPMKQCQ